MSGHVPVEQLLRWRLARAEAEAPPAPSAAHLLELARPPWERWPARFEALVSRLSAMRLTYGYAQAGVVRPHGHPVPTLIDDSHGTETFSRVLYFTVREGVLRLRFHLDAGADVPAYDATLVDESTARPVLAARATLSLDREYRLDAAVPEALAAAWASLKATDAMPFRLILQPAGDQPTSDAP
jgi:hypothetical protein